MTFTKLFSSITESTLWQEDANTRLVWITMLAMADRMGRVWGSVPGLAHRARVPVDDCREALKKFMSPDLDSRTTDKEGRRIEEMDCGGVLLNHGKYRAIRDEEAIKESKRKHINTKRAIERGVENVDRCRANAEAEAEAIVQTSDLTTNFEKLKLFLQRLYHRNGNKPLTRLEMESVLEVSRSVDCLAEFDLISSYRARLPKGEQKYFPGSLRALCEKWNDVVDRARNFKEPSCL